MRLHSLLSFCILLSSTVIADDAPTVDYSKDVAPILTKYCAGCHNDSDREAEFSLESYASLQQGTEDGPAVLPGDASSSLIWRLIQGDSEPKMPPEDEPQPSPEELEKLRLWIEQGAKGPDGDGPDRLMIRAPAIETHTDLSPITAMAISEDGEALAIGRFGEATIYRNLRTVDPETGKKKRDWQPAQTLKDIPGKVSALHFTKSGTHLVTASGVTGSGGIATLWEWPLGRRVRDFKGHRDQMFDAEVSPDGKLLATCSYDREILLWDLETGEQVRQLLGHNGAVYDVAFSPDGSTLASASADDTCKVWRVRDGERLDTLGQPLKECYTVEFSPDGKFIVASGADNRIRVWRFVSKERPRINPQVYARFAHEAAVLKIAFTPDGSRLISTAEDRTVKVWDTRDYTEILLLNDQPEIAAAVAVSQVKGSFLLGRLNGSWDSLKLPSLPQRKTDAESDSLRQGIAATVESPMNTVEEQEPNADASQAQLINAPSVIKGKIDSESGTDEDFFKFSAKTGEEWVVEVNAARSKSPLDSFVEVLSADGKPIERALLQAVRDSYFTFRGKDGNQSNDFRVFNWEEMELNEFLYANGEVAKLWLYPRGPDSGFDVYPGSGTRWGYFDTTPLAHALGEPCYIVQPHAPGSDLIPNGLPVFRLFYENDDESRRTMGSDSKLLFTAPDDGDYVIRLRDVRGQQGKNYTYQLTLRPRQPDFQVSIENRKLSVHRGSATEIRFRANRLDQFDGPVSIQVANLPAGLTMASPIVIEEGQIQAYGVLVAAADTPEISPERLKEIQISATASIRGQDVMHSVTGFEEIKLPDNPPVTIAIHPAEKGAVPVNQGNDGPLEFVIDPGETIMLKVVATRHSHTGEISFGKEDAGRNLPFGTYVDNIGLNGLLLLEGQNEREFFVTCAKWVPNQSRLFHLKTGVGGEQATVPVVLHVRGGDRNVAEQRK
ncbi:MAG: hypothetical protein KDA80_12245 [Planctomycetaceae bacterium]|nr:hypothetical protein [Planctomycetaceae bacterium]